ncbi:helix-turn-helix transcriptional regulator [Leifsonia flava]|uniref:helix-turn-helix transcriptional regulator n=1 Tax=Orlajensenia leifsoniae TaxID=2561933 RepID=UPI00195E0633|nr:LuxR family transcriptional regulator [Leifsonia flava]
MTSGEQGRPAALIGRRRECAKLAGLLDHVRSGTSQALVLSGEAGIGKTALLSYVREQAKGCAVLEAAGVQSEMELAYAGLHQLCAPLLGHLATIPQPQREALSTALGLSNGNAPDRFLVGLAVLSLLAEASRERPLVCIIDDAHWLDQASLLTIAFVARRLRAEAVGMLFAVRELDVDEALSPLPRISVTGLSEAASRQLLTTAIAGPLDATVRERIVAETHGNPLALLQLPSGLTMEQIAGGFGLSGLGALTNRIEQSFRRRLATMPAATLRLLTIAAAEPGQDEALIWRAADRLGVDVKDAEPAVDDGYATFSGYVRFCHPLARSTVYKAALPEERQAAHRALADATDPTAEPERRAWHLAQASSGLDEAVAAELERSADSAQARGGQAAAAAFHERAAELTPDPARRAERALVAARSKYDAGSPERAHRLLAIAEIGASSEHLKAQIELLQAQISSRLHPGDGTPLLHAAARLEPIDLAQARETYRDAFYAALTAGPLGHPESIAQVAAAARTSTKQAPAENAFEVALDGLAKIIEDGYADGAPQVKSALAAARSSRELSDSDLRWMPFAGRLALDVWDPDSALDFSTTIIESARRRGDFSTLPTALLGGIGYLLFAGDLATASMFADECEMIGDNITIPTLPFGRLVVAAVRGQELEVVSLVDRVTPVAMAMKGGQWLTATAWAEAVLYNGLGRFDRALAAAERGSRNPNELGLASWSMVEQVEAAACSGHPERAVEPMRRLTEMAKACSTDWILGVAARSEALLAEEEDAEVLHRTAIEHLERTQMRTDWARAQLLYGEWLRRQDRRTESRKHLRQAHDAFTEIGAEGFVDRARGELLATGENVHRLSSGNHVQLTEQELQIAHLAASGLTNPQIATRLFISARTVEWHLRKVFVKLDIKSRQGLNKALEDSPVTQRPVNARLLTNAP